MRTFKFRGKDTITHKWLYDDLIYFDAKAVDLDTVGQFTGLRDMSGQEIYEGDIVISAAGAGSVKWMPGKYCFQVSPKGIFISPKCKIIGNIYDNPELLRQIKDGEKELPRRPE